ncbi:hypothetical protein BUALT_Bualt19G0035200 [Buddleja alternifolia]|uniref:DUF659 domain-containing protein n=1 Tax=Buddleja alternifolia TaxID=168488 RepID=A0AAV6W4S6_9LAMI|nr:hypothetical protein BUALT_Bualt19G0035200 [Buddleja alternifolia]
MKQHLAGIRGNVTPCKKVPPEVRFMIQGSLKENSEKAKEKREAIHIDDQLGANIDDSHVDDDIQEITPRPAQREGHNNVQPTPQGKEKAQLDWMLTLKVAMSKVASMGHGYTGPRYHALRVTLLKDAKKHVELIVDSFRSKWIETGCTIMGNGWRDSRQRPLINFLVYYPTGISFIKSVDTSGIEANAKNLCDLFADIVEMVGVRNVVHMVTDNASNYKAAGHLLCDRYPTITWSPCAPHCINLIMKDIGEMPNVSDLSILASRIICYVYNNKWPLNWLRKREGWKEIIRPGDTRFATTFIALKSLSDHKKDLQGNISRVQNFFEERQSKSS